MRRILVTGASSFLGTILVRRLIERGDNVHVIVRAGTDPARIDSRIPQANRHLVSEDAASVFAAVQQAQPTTVFHLASLYLRSARETDVVPLVRANIEFGVLLCEAINRLQNPVHFVNFGTYSQFYSENPQRALDLYSALKTAFAQLLDYYADAHGLRFASLTLYDSYGPGDWRQKIVRVLCDALAKDDRIGLSDQNIIIDLTHIEDVADAALQMASLLETDAVNMTGKQFAVSGERLSLFDLVQLIERISGREIAADWGAYPLPARRILAPVILPAVPGWRPKIDLKTGLSTLINPSR